MANYRFPTAEPDTTVPFALRLAQFLLQSSNQLGEYQQGLNAQTKLSQDLLDQSERSDDRKSLLAERQRTFDITERDRKDKAAADLAKRTATNKLFVDLSKMNPGAGMPPIEDP